VALLAGCNAVFDIHGGLPWPNDCKNVLTIDDMEDGIGDICNSGGRHGDWYTVSDGTSPMPLSPVPGEPFTPAKIPGGRDGSRYAARMFGAGFTGWGALMGFNLNVQGLENKPYSAATTGGIRFWMKSNVPVAVRFPVAETIPLSEAGMCSDTAESRNCNNHFQYLIAQPDPGEWAEYDVPYTALAQQTLAVDTKGNYTFGTASWSPGELIGVQFAVPLVATATQVSFDVWVDDVRFYGCQGADCRPTCNDPAAPVPCPALDGAPAGCWPAGTTCSAVPFLVNTFGGLWGSGPNDVWTVGLSNVKTPTAAAAHWNGTAWSVNRDAAARPLAGVWGSGPNDVWAVGDWGTIQHWDGAEWRDAESPTTLWLTGIWGSAADDVWAVGFTLTGDAGIILHWNGSEWLAVPSGAPQPLNRVWSNGPSDAWAVGYSIVHWNGSSWLGVRSPIDTIVGALVGIWGSGGDDVWAVGTGGLILHWDGNTWERVDSPTTRILSQVWGSGRGDVWAVGEAGTILHWNGNVWSVVPPSAIRAD
jgi:hypothetical protein